MKALIIVDVQNDFCPGGSLAVENGDKIIPNINKLANSGYFDIVVATQDWHPESHISFASTHNVTPFTDIGGEQGLVWPNHCIAGTKGAELRPSIDTKPINMILRKGMKLNLDSYSAFLENDKETPTGLANYLDVLITGHGLTNCPDIYVVGIATDVCVFNTAMDAADYVSPEKVFVIEDACAGVSIEGIEQATKSMKEKGINFINVKDILK